MWCCHFLTLPLLQKILLRNFLQLFSILPQIVEKIYIFVATLCQGVLFFLFMNITVYFRLFLQNIYLYKSAKYTEGA